MAVDSVARQMAMNALENGGGGGGDSGTTNYNELENKPKINNIPLVGNKSTADLGIIIPDVSDFITDTEVEELLADYVTETVFDSTIAGFYTKSETDALLTTKADKATTYTKSETDAHIAEKVAEIVADAPEDFDTLKEMSDWIENHEESAAAMNSAIQGKVDKVSGKGLSTNDFTDDLLSKLGALTFKSVLQGQRNHIPMSYTYTMKMSDFGSAYNGLGIYLLFFVTWSTTPSISIYAVAYSGGTLDNVATLKIAGEDQTITVSDGVISFSAPGLVRIIALS